MSTSSVIPFAIILGGVILAGAVYLTLKPDSFSSTNLASATHMRPVSQDDHILGSPTAQIMVVEYSDFDCSHCAIFSTTMHQVLKDYGTSGDVAWVSRNYAITELHPNARKHAEAAECVAEVGGNDAYFKFADLLFSHQPASPLNYAEYAKTAGANPDAVASCIQNAGTNGIDERIDADRQNAIDSGAQGTPYSILLINGHVSQVIDGDMPYDLLNDTITQALAK